MDNAFLNLIQYSHSCGKKQYVVVAPWESCLQSQAAHGGFALPGWRLGISESLYRDTEPGSFQQEQLISRMCPVPEAVAFWSGTEEPLKEDWHTVYQDWFQFLRWFEILRRNVKEQDESSWPPRSPRNTSGNFLLEVSHRHMEQCELLSKCDLLVWKTTSLGKKENKNEENILNVHFY